jgi:hypothetical protein
MRITPCRRLMALAPVTILLLVEAGQAVLMGTIREAGVATILVVRLGTAGRRIREVETLVIRNQSAAESLDRIGTPRRAWLTAVPDAERRSRDELVRVANMYWEDAMSSRPRTLP